MKQTAVDWLIEEINNQQKRYIDLAKKDKSKSKAVDAILTATTLLKMKCNQAKELEKQQITDAYEASFDNYLRYVEGMDNEILPEQYYNETFKNK